jgi:hypothetical protein
MARAQTQEEGRARTKDKHMRLVPFKKFVNFNGTAGCQALPDGDGEEVLGALHQVVCPRQYPDVRPVPLVRLRLWDAERKRRHRGEGDAVLRLDEDVTKGRLGFLVTA